jgi:tetratricopeptide (TPR) repeat protein
MLDITKRLTLFLAFLAMPAILLFAQEDKKISALLAEADILIISNNLSDALSKTQEAISLSPSNLQAMQKRINIFYLMNNDKEAIRYADDALKQYPDEPEFYYLRGIINNSREKYIKALDDFDQAINMQPGDNSYRSYLGRGVSHLNLLEYEQALSDFSKSIELNDTVASAYYSRALVNYEIKEYSTAVDDFLKVLDLTKENPALLFNLGMSYYRLNEKEKACPYFNKSCKLGNENACRMTLMECVKALPNIQ